MQKSSDLNKAAEATTENQPTDNDDEEELDEIDKQIIERQENNHLD